MIDNGNKIIYKTLNHYTRLELVKELKKSLRINNYDFRHTNKYDLMQLIYHIRKNLLR
jgi:hypothetical protein